MARRYKVIDLRKSGNTSRHSHYDKYLRDKDSQRFYHSAAWQSARDKKLQLNPLCEACEQAGRVTVAKVVHHSIPVKDGTHKLELKFLVSLCHACHNKIETEIDIDNAST